MAIIPIDPGGGSRPTHRWGARLTWTCAIVNNGLMTVHAKPRGREADFSVPW